MTQESFAVDTRPWRVGTHYGIHWYAENPGNADDEPLGTALRPEIAAQVVRDHNALYGAGGLWLNPYPAMAQENARLRDEVLNLKRRLRDLEHPLIFAEKECRCE